MIASLIHSCRFWVATFVLVATSVLVAGLTVLVAVVTSSTVLVAVVTSSSLTAPAVVFLLSRASAIFRLLSSSESLASSTYHISNLFVETSADHLSAALWEQ